MDFHPTARDRIGFLLMLFICVGLVCASAYVVFRRGDPGGQFGQTLGVTGVLLLVSLYVNWMAWSVKVRVHESGVDWTEGKKSGSLTWDKISGFGWKVERKSLRVGLVEKPAQELRILPFMSPSLYDALRGKVGRLPAEVEKSLGFRV